MNKKGEMMIGGALWKDDDRGSTMKGGVLSKLAYV